MLLVVVRRRVLAGGRAAVGLDLLLVVVGVGDGRVGGNGQSLSQSVSRLAPGGWAPITQAIHTYIHRLTARRRGITRGEGPSGSWVGSEATSAVSASRGSSRRMVAAWVSWLVCAGWLAGVGGCACWIRRVGARAVGRVSVASEALLASALKTISNDEGSEKKRQKAEGTMQKAGSPFAAAAAGRKYALGGR